MLKSNLNCITKIVYSRINEHELYNTNMIIKQISMKSINKSSFKNLLGYLTNDQGHRSRVGDISYTNLQSDTLNSGIIEIQKTQRQNTRCKTDKTMHLVVSFQEGESCSNEVLKKIEQDICDSLGLGSHQRISVVHHDTDNLHLHIGINKIDPVTHRYKDPYRSFYKLSEVAQICEEKYSLRKDNHIKSKLSSESVINTMETHRGEESLCGQIRNLKDELSDATNWEEFHKILEDNGLGVKVRANGLVFFNDQGIHIKASTVDRNFSKSKLEKKLGIFEESESSPTNNTSSEYLNKKSAYKFANEAEENLWQEYQNLRYKNNQKMNGNSSNFSNTSSRFDFDSSSELSSPKSNSNYDLYKSEAETLYQTIGLEYKIIGLLKLPKFMRAYFNFYLSTMAKLEKDKIKQKCFNQTYLKNQKKQSWLKFLEDKALNGDVTAEELLKKRQKKSAQSSAKDNANKSNSSNNYNNSKDNNNYNATENDKRNNRQSSQSNQSQPETEDCNQQKQQHPKNQFKHNENKAFSVFNKSFVIHEDSENFAKFRMVKEQIEKSLKPECVTSRGNKIYRYGDSYIKVTDTTIEKNFCNLNNANKTQSLKRKANIEGNVHFVNKDKEQAAIISEFKRFVRTKYSKRSSLQNVENQTTNDQQNSNSFFMNHRVPTTDEIMLDKLDSFTGLGTQRELVKSYLKLSKIVANLESNHEFHNQSMQKDHEHKKSKTATYIHASHRSGLYSLIPSNRLSNVNDLSRNGKEQNSLLRTSSFTNTNTNYNSNNNNYSNGIANTRITTKINTNSNNNNNSITKGPKR